MRRLIPALLTAAATGAAADPLALSVLDAERQLAAHAQHAALRSAEPDTAERLDAQLRLLELHVADQQLSSLQRQKAETVLRLLQAVRDQPQMLNGQPALPHPTIAVGDAGRSCAQAIPLDQGDARRIPIGAGESLWFRVQLPDAVNLGLSTRGSSVDAALTVHADCRTVDQAAVASADDNYGLQAELVVPAARQRYWVVRYENLSPVGGEAVLRATTSGILKGTVLTRDGQLVPGRRHVHLYQRQNGIWISVISEMVMDDSFIIPIIAPGIYAARTRRALDSAFVDQAFNDILCVGSGIEGCNNGNVTEIPHDGTETRNIAFRLDRGIPVIGTVRDTAGRAIANARVDLQVDGDDSVSSVRTDAAGRYRFDGNPPGIARLIAVAQRHRPVLYDNIPCTDPCGFPFAATPLPLTPGSTAIADFFLPPAPTLNVTVSLSNDQIGNLPTALTLSLLRTDGTLVDEKFLLGFTSFSGVEPGEYLLRLQSPNIIPRLYPDIECAGDCVAELAQAERIVIPALQVEISISFQARRYPMIFGTLRDRQSGQPITEPNSFGQIELLQLGSGTVSAFNARDGEYFLRGVAPGTYALRASYTNHQSSVHSGYTCDRPLNECNEFTPITVSRTGPDQRIDFSLSRLGRLIVTRNDPTFSNTLAIMNTAGVVSSEFSIFDSAATTIVDGIPLGTQIIGLTSAAQIPQLFSGVNCLASAPSSFLACPFTLATPLMIQSGQSQQVSFSLIPVNARRVLVRGADHGMPLSGVSLDLWDGTGVLIGSFVTGPDGGAWIRNHTSSNSTQQFALSTDNRQGYVDQVHAGISCPNGSAFLGLCSLSGATPISLPAPDNNQPTIEILLQRETPRFRNGFEPSN